MAGGEKEEEEKSGRIGGLAIYTRLVQCYILFPLQSYFILIRGLELIPISSKSSPSLLKSGLLALKVISSMRSSRFLLASCIFKLWESHQRTFREIDLKVEGRGKNQ